jgi:hypothetical protein
MEWGCKWGFISLYHRFSLCIVCVSVYHISRFSIEFLLVFTVFLLTYILFFGTGQWEVGDKTIPFKLQYIVLVFVFISAY